MSENYINGDRWIVGQKVFILEENKYYNVDMVNEGDTVAKISTKYIYLSSGRKFSKCSLHEVNTNNFPVPLIFCTYEDLENWKEKKQLIDTLMKEISKERLMNLSIEQLRHIQYTLAIHTLYKRLTGGGFE